MNIEIYNSDCLEAMKKMPDKCYDLAIVDPPYGIGEDGRKNHTRGCIAKSRSYEHGAKYDNSPPPVEYFNELIRISKNQIVFGANHFISKIPLDSSCWIVWDKDNGETDFADCELAWTSFTTAVRKFKFRWQGMLQQNMKDKEQQIHPNHKPIALYKWLLRNYATPGDKILDTHGGSMSSVIACIDGGFDITCFELDKDYYDAAMVRINNHIRQTDMFSDRADIVIKQNPDQG